MVNPHAPVDVSPLSREEERIQEQAYLPSRTTHPQKSACETIPAIDCRRETAEERRLAAIKIGMAANGKYITIINADGYLVLRDIGADT